MAFYLFPGVMFRRYQEGKEVFSALYGTAKKSSSAPDDIPFTLQGHYKFYEFTTQQYLGFGALLQFIPGTNANLARKQLSNELESAIYYFKSDYSHINPFIPRNLKLKGEDGITRTLGFREFYWFKKHSLISPLSTFLNFGPLFKTLDDIAEGFKSKHIRINFKKPVTNLACMLPFLNDIFFVNDNQQITVRKDALKNIVHSILNPLRIIDDALNFLHEVICRVIEIGSERDFTTTPRAILKGITGLFFGMMQMPVKTLKHLVELPLNAATLLFISPITHFASSIRSAYQNRDKEVLIATKKELQDVKELRKTAQDKEDTTFSKIKKPSANGKYIGINKNDLYCKHGTNSERLVAIRASKEKVNQTSSLLSIVRFFNESNLVAKEEPAAIEQAREVLPTI